MTSLQLSCALKFYMHFADTWFVYSYLAAFASYNFFFALEMQEIGKNPGLSLGLIKLLTYTICTFWNPPLVLYMAVGYTFSYLALTLCNAAMKIIGL